MRKLIIIIILLISSFSYYGVVDEDGEKITVYDNVVDEQSITDQVSEDDAIIERIVKENENVETKNEIVKVEQEEIENAKVQEQQNKTTDNTIKQQTIIKSAEQKAQVTTNTSKEDDTSVNKEEITGNVEQNNSYTEKEVMVVEKTECVGNNHKIESGNTGKWFNNKVEADDYYNTEIEKWGKLWENDEITKEEYLKNCPFGYEIWTCPQCQKWTLNFYYR